MSVAEFLGNGQLTIAAKSVESVHEPNIMIAEPVLV